MKKLALTLIFSVTALTLLVTASFNPALSQICIAQTQPSAPFSVIWITDTQYLSESYPAYFDNLTQWIVDNRATYNVQMVIHTGDIINDPDNLTEWENANKSMSLLLNAGIPYCWDAGNHDYDWSGTDLWMGSQFTAFSPQAMQSKTYWVSDDLDGENTAVNFTSGGSTFIVINIAFDANSTVLAWANNLLNEYPQAHAIVATHAFINQQCSYDAWALNLKKTVLDTHPNVFLTLNGHYHPSADNFTEVGGRWQLVYNQQDASSGMGADAARILTFNVAKGTITVQTYSQLTNQFLKDPADNFTLKTSFRNDAAAAGNVPEFSSGIFAFAASSAAVVVCLIVVGRRIRFRAVDRRRN